MPFDRFTGERDMQRETHDTGVRAAPSSRPTAGRNGFGAFECGTSAAAQRVRKLVEQSVASDLPVLITGEVGVGKDLIAREIHRRSARGGTPLLEVNCAALSDDDELFAGEVPPNGTLFLNGVGELSPSLQERLFTLLRCDEDADGATPGRGLRAIAATHRDLAHAVEAGSFNEDLYYCINLIHIHVPPLRSRLEDVPALLQHFLHEHGRRDGSQEQVPQSIRSRMMGYEWPGNLRELENTIRSFVALNDPEYVLEELAARASERERSIRPPAHAFASGHPPPHGSPDHNGYHIDLKKLGREASDAAERDAILAMLAHTMGNKKAAARRLGISYKALLYKIRDYGLADAHASDDHIDPESDKSHTVTPAD